MEENLVDVYYKRIMEAENPVGHLLSFYSTLFGIDFDKSKIATFSKLNKLYGRRRIFKSLLTMYSMTEVNHSNIYPLLNHFCVQQVNEEMSAQPVLSLANLIEDSKTKIDRMKLVKLKIKPLEEAE